MPLAFKIALIEEEIYYRSIMPEFKAEENEYGHTKLPEDHATKLASDNDYKTSFDAWQKSKLDSFNDNEPLKTNWQKGQAALNSGTQKKSDEVSATSEEKLKGPLANKKIPIKTVNAEYQNWQITNDRLTVGKLQKKTIQPTNPESPTSTTNIITDAQKETLKNFDEKAREDKLAKDIEAAVQKLKEAEEKRKEAIKSARNNAETKKKDAEAKQLELQELKKQLQEASEKVTEQEKNINTTDLKVTEANKKATVAKATANEAQKKVDEDKKAKDDAKKITETSGVDATTSNTKIKEEENTLRLLRELQAANQESKKAEEALKQAKLESAKAEKDLVSAQKTLNELKEQVSESTLKAGEAKIDAQYALNASNEFKNRDEASKTITNAIRNYNKNKADKEAKEKEAEEEAKRLAVEKAAANASKGQEDDLSVLKPPTSDQNRLNNHETHEQAKPKEKVPKQKYKEPTGAAKTVFDDIRSSETQNKADPTKAPHSISDKEKDTFINTLIANGFHKAESSEVKLTSKGKEIPYDEIGLIITEHKDKPFFDLKASPETNAVITLPTKDSKGNDKGNVAIEYENGKVVNLIPHPKDFEIRFDPNTKQAVGFDKEGNIAQHYPFDRNQWKAISKDLEERSAYIDLAKSYLGYSKEDKNPEVEKPLKASDFIGENESPILHNLRETASKAYNALPSRPTFKNNTKKENTAETQAPTDESKQEPYTPSTTKKLISNFRIGFSKPRQPKVENAADGQKATPVKQTSISKITKGYLTKLPFTSGR